MNISRRRLIASASTALPAASLLSGLGLHNSCLGGVETTEGNKKDFIETTKASEKAVEKATAFIKRTQNRDGSCGVDINQQSDIGCTSMCGLALLSQGNTPIEGRQSKELKKMRDFILQQTKSMPSDDITSATGTQLQRKIGRHAHSFFAALFLSQIVGEAPNPEATNNGLRKVVDAIVKAQT